MSCTSALAEATKMKQRKNLTDKTFYERKFPDLRYFPCMGQVRIDVSTCVYTWSLLHMYKGWGVGVLGFPRGGGGGGGE